MTFAGRRRTDINRLARQGQREFRRELVAVSKPALARLSKAYKNVLTTLDQQLLDLDAIAQTRGMTAQELRRSEALARLQARMRGELSDYADLLAEEAKRLQSGAPSIGAKLGAFLVKAAGVSASFNQPTVEFMRQLINYVDTPGFRYRLSNYAGYHTQYIADMIPAYSAQGKGPRAIVGAIRQYIKEFPRADGERMVRTVQIWSARRGTQEFYRANPNIVRGWIWSSSLDRRTCPACLANHGKRFPVSQVLNGHHLCRCAMIPDTGTWAEMGISGGQEMPAMETGEQWFRKQPADVQREILGPTLLAAYKDDQFTLADVPRTYDDGLYGLMVRAASANEILGAEKFRAYRRQPNVR